MAGNPAGTPGAPEALLAQAERDAELVAAKARVAISVVLIVVVQAILWAGLPDSAFPLQRQMVLNAVENALLFLGALLGVGLLSYAAVRRDWLPGFRPFLTSGADAALILGNIADLLLASDLPGGLIPVLPVTFAIPLVLGAAAIHYRPSLQLFLIAIYGTGLAALFFVLGPGSIEERAAGLHASALMFGTPPNAVRMVMLLLLGGVLVLVTMRGRALLYRAVEEAGRRASLARFLPGEISPLLWSPQARSLRDGRRQVATVVFVDIRDSTHRAETLDPRALSIFIAAFRRRVTQAAQAHRGVVDKFVGDGALVVFGVPEPAPDDAARGLAFAAELLRRVERWNGKRGFDPPVRVGIGLHTGEVYCGLVGDDDRIEFTVLGDAVNVAARLEEATKRYGLPVLASEATLVAAGAPGAEVAQEILRGRAHPTRIMTPA
ncbi:MAG TPA: adenylate/guanylate cyclase domain-containing protein [Beijerinckiaceae bacterium]|nr:adenylate/guanylate cyclase domain-containing protein [Beijerinckiaceae bacterium]